MNQFVKKASSKISKMSDEQILRIINTQTADLRLRNLALDNSYIGYLLVGNDGNIAYMNRQTTLLVPIFKRKSYANVPLKNTIMHDNLLSFLDDCLEDENANKTYLFEFDDPGAGKKYINCMSLKLKEFEGVLFTFSDVTYFHRFKDEFRKNESLASMTTMAAGVAHEIKNPLASISIYLQLLDRELIKKGSVDKQTADKYLSVVKEEVDRLNSIAVDFLFAVKPMNVNLEKANINDVVNKVVKVVFPEVQTKNISLDLRLATSIPNVLIDPSLMQQAVLNLVKNAIQAMEDGNIKSNTNLKKDTNLAYDKLITITSFIDGEFVALVIADTGCGMTESQVEKIFEPYYTTKSNGTGLGLTVLFKIIKAFSGDVSVHSTLGEGSEFTIKIPIPKDERYRLSFESEKCESEKFEDEKSVNERAEEAVK